MRSAVQGPVLRWSGGLGLLSGGSKGGMKVGGLKDPKVLAPLGLISFTPHSELPEILGFHNRTHCSVGRFDGVWGLWFLWDFRLRPKCKAHKV